MKTTTCSLSRQGLSWFFAFAALALSSSWNGLAAAPAQQAYVKASNTGSGDLFGFAMAISGDTMVIGAPYEDSNATGVNGIQSDDSFRQSGAAYVFVRVGTNWSQQAYLKASNTDPAVWDDNIDSYVNDYFGWSVAVSGDTIVVGALKEDSAATGINGNEDSNFAPNSGAAYVFVRRGTNWHQQAYLKASNAESYDYFASSVAISGDTIVIGADGEDSNAVGVNGNQADNSAANSGAAYIFVRDGTNWNQQAYLKASNAEARDFFGCSVAISGETVAVGAFGEASGTTGVNGDQSDNSLYLSGAAYIFARTGTNWSQQAYLKASNAGFQNWFGYSVAASGNSVVVGAGGEESSATGVNGNQNDETAGYSGAAYVFVRDGTNWSQQAYLKASNTDYGDHFAESLAISGDTIVAGAPNEESSATGVNGPQDNDTAWCCAGAAYVFVRDGTNWTQQAYLKASNTGARVPVDGGGDLFGIAVAASDDTVVGGAIHEDSNATGVNAGRQSDNSASWSGASYVFVGLGTGPILAGPVDTTFKPGEIVGGCVCCLAAQPDGKIVLGGSFTSINGTSRNRIARLNADGSLDNTFDPGTGADGWVNSIALQPDGKIILGGFFSSMNRSGRNRIARLNADGSLDNTFAVGAGADWDVWAVASQPDGKVLVGGAFYFINGMRHDRIARLNTNGSADNTFNTGVWGDETVYCVALQADGKVLIGGSFTFINGYYPNRIARLSADGSVDGAFDPVTGADGYVSSIVVHPDGKVLLGGGFVTFNGISRSGIARLNPDGTVDGTFDVGTGANDSVEAIALQPDGKVLVAGGFTTIDGISRNHIARLNADGSLDRTFNPGTGTDNWVNAIGLQPDGNIVIGGSFTSVNGIARTYVARLLGNPVAPPPIRLQLVADGNGGYFIRGTGRAGCGYQFERALNVTGPWSAIATSVAPSSGLVEFHEEVPPSRQAFYRTVTP